MTRQDIIKVLRVLGGIIAALGLLGALILLFTGLKLLTAGSAGAAGLAVILQAFATAVTACFLAAIGFGIAELLETAVLILNRLTPLPSLDTNHEAPPEDDYVLQDPDKTGRVQVYKRRIDQEPNVVIDTYPPQDDPTLPLRLRRPDDHPPEVDAIATAFKCPWCNQPYEIESGKNALFKCAKCGNDVLATFI